MAGWQIATFANEEASLWLDDLLDERDPYFIHNTLEIVIDCPADEKPEAWDCGCALAAAEVVAAARGNPPEQFPSEASEWIEAYGIEADPEVLELVRRAVVRIETDSRMREEMEADGRLPEWLDCLQRLRRRLGFP